MSDEPPERWTVSIPPDSDLDPEEIQARIDDGDFESRSEYIRECLKSDLEDSQIDS